MSWSTNLSMTSSSKPFWYIHVATSLAAPSTYFGVVEMGYGQGDVVVLALGNDRVRCGFSDGCLEVGKGCLGQQRRHLQCVVEAIVTEGLRGTEQVRALGAFYGLGKIPLGKPRTQFITRCLDLFQGRDGGLAAAVVALVGWLAGRSGWRRSWRHGATYGRAAVFFKVA